MNMSYVAELMNNPQIYKSMSEMMKNPILLKQAIALSENPAFKSILEQQNPDTVTGEDEIPDICAAFKSILEQQNPDTVTGEELKETASEIPDICTISEIPDICTISEIPDICTISEIPPTPPTKSEIEINDRLKLLFK
jgi:hypothetical protein